MHRSQRTLTERVVFAQVYRCPSCKRRFRRPHEWIRVPVASVAWLFALHSTCIRCGTTNVRRCARDRIDTKSRNVFSLIQKFTGAPLYRCEACRLIYNDWRRSARVEEKELKETS